MRTHSIAVAFLLILLFAAGCAGGRKKIEKARAKLGAGDYDAAIALLDDVLAGEPDVEALWLRASALYEKGRKDRAAADLERAALLLNELAGEDPSSLAGKYPFLDDLFFRLFELRCPFERSEWSAKGYTAPDLSFSREDAGRLGALLVVYDRIRPDDPRPPLLLGKCSLLGGYPVAAYNYFSACISRGGEDPWVYKWRGDAALRIMGSGDPKLAGKMRNRALDNYNRAIDLDPKTPSFFYARGLYFEKTGNPERALSDFKAALSLDPDFAPAHFDMALLLRSTGRYDQALEHLTRCIELAPDFPEPYYHRAHLYFSANRRLSGVGNFRRACSLARADLETLLRLMPGICDGWSLYGDVLRWSGELKAAAEAFGKAVACDPAGHNAYYRRGDVYGLMGKWDECFADLTRAIEICDDLDPQYYLYWFTRGKYRQIAAAGFARAGDLDRAAELHRQAVEDFAQTWKHYRRLVVHLAEKEGRDPVRLTADEAETMRCILSLWVASCRALGDDEQLKRLTALMRECRPGAVVGK